LLLTSDRKRALEIRFRFQCIVLSRLERYVAGNAMNLGFKPSFSARFDITALAAR
jgi:hypothetical protein